MSNAQQNRLAHRPFQAALLWLWLAAAASPSMAAQQPVSVPTAAAEEFHFAVLGDSQFHDPAGFNRLINDLIWLGPAFTVQVGDMIQGYAGVDQARKEWQRFRDQIRPLEAANIAFMPVAGNHDVLASSRKPTQALKQLYEQTWGATYYQFQYGNSAFLILNTDEPGASRRIGGEQWTWLEQTLAANAALSHRFVFMHRPPDSLRDAQALHALLVRHRVHTVFYGHHHHYHFRAADGVQYIMTNAAANSATELAGVGSFDHLLQVSVRDDAVRIAVITADSVQGPDTVAPQDNYDLFALRRGLFAEPLVLRPQASHSATHKLFNLEVALHNTSERDVRVYLHCTSDDERWVFSPRALAAINLPRGSSHTVSLVARQGIAAPASGTPTCSAQFPYQLSNGRWHNRTVQSNPVCRKSQRSQNLTSYSLRPFWILDCFRHIPPNKRPTCMPKSMWLEAVE